MSKPRADLGFGDALGDLSSFTPKSKSAPRADSAQAARAVQAAEASGFQSREPKPAAAAAKPPRRRRTGRNAQFNIKARPETIEAFYKVADANGWGLGETLEHAVALLEKEYL
jgi:hypothetical protein